MLERAGDVLGLEGVHAYRASLIRLRAANDIAWQTALLVEATFAVQMIEVGLRGRPNARAVLAAAAVLLAASTVATLRFRGYGRRIQAKLDRIDRG